MSKMLSRGILSVMESIPRIADNVLNDNDLSELKTASRLVGTAIVLVLVILVAQSCM